MPLLSFSAGMTTVSSDVSVVVSMVCTELLIQADPSNTITVLLGTSTAQPIKLSAGATVTLPVSHGANVGVKTSAGSATINWIANSLRF